MAAERNIVVDVLLWQGVTIEVSYEESWLGMERSNDRAVAHLSITAIEPERTRLPMTETGYRSHFVHPDEVAADGGPVAYVQAWLDGMARSREWIAYEQATRQMSLF